VAAVALVVSRVYAQRSVFNPICKPGPSLFRATVPGDKAAEIRFWVIHTAYYWLAAETRYRPFWQFYLCSSRHKSN